MKPPHNLSPEEAMQHIGDVADAMLSEILASVLGDRWGVMDLTNIAREQDGLDPCAKIARTIIVVQLARNIYETPIDFMADVPAIVLSVRQSRIPWVV